MECGEQGAGMTAGSVRWRSIAVKAIDRAPLNVLPRHRNPTHSVPVRQNLILRAVGIGRNDAFPALWPGRR